jgi:hypothetical protein
MVDRITPRKARPMLSVLILEPDPVIALDLSEAARYRDPQARVKVAETLPEAQTALQAGGCPTYAFLRFPDPNVSRDATRTMAQREIGLARSLAARGARVVATGVDALPPSLAGSPGVVCLPFPFGAGQVAALLDAGPGPHAPEAA